MLVIALETPTSSPLFLGNFIEEEGKYSSKIPGPFSQDLNKSLNEEPINVGPRVPGGNNRMSSGLWK